MSIKSILLEATEYTDGASLAKAILRGQIAGVSKKFFNNEEPNIQILDKLVNLVQKNFDKQLQNKAIVLLLNKAKSIDDLQYADNQIIDATKAYFDNINKKEAKKPEIKKLFDKFEEVNLTDSFNQEFEKTIDEIFEDSAEMKSADEYEIIYSIDEKGWEVVVPKTFAAAKYLSSFKGVGKAYWCTAAHAANFKDYTKNNNKLYIIRNLKKKKFYQMDWGYRYNDENFQTPSFQNFKNKEITLSEIFNNIPDKVLDAIKNKKGISVLQAIKGNETKETNKVNEWSLKKLDRKDFLNLCKQYKIKITTNIKDDTFKASYFLDNRKNVNEIEYFLLEKKNKKYLFIKENKGYVYFYINGKRIHFPIFELKKDGTYTLKNINIFVDEKFPIELKKYFYQNEKEVEKPDYKDYSTKNYKVYLINNLAGLRRILNKDFYINLSNTLEKISKEITASKKSKSKLTLDFNNSFEKKLYSKVENNQKLNLLCIKKGKNALCLFMDTYDGIFIKNDVYDNEVSKGQLRQDIETFFGEDIFLFLKEKFPTLYKNFLLADYDKADKNFKYFYATQEPFIINNKRWYEITSYRMAKKFYYFYKNHYDFDDLKYLTRLIYVINNKVYPIDNDYYKNNKKEIEQIMKNFKSSTPVNIFEKYTNFRNQQDNYFNSKDIKNNTDELRKIKERIRSNIV